LVSGGKTPMLLGCTIKSKSSLVWHYYMIYIIVYLSWIVVQVPFGLDYF